jgi:hypothetical protein
MVAASERPSPTGEQGIGRSQNRLGLLCWARWSRARSFACDRGIKGSVTRVTNQGPAAGGRSCGPCTACCDGWLKIEVHGHAVDRGNPCRFSVDHRCSIYDTRPQRPCREFICGWLAQGSPLPEWMRPDKADMIVLAANATWQGRPVDVAVAAGDRPKTKALEPLKTFCAERKRLLLHQIDEEWYAFGPSLFQHETGDRVGRGERLWT